MYAMNCFVKTQEHLNKANDITNYEELSVYDFTVGYPNKVILTII